MEKTSVAEAVSKIKRLTIWLLERNECWHEIGSEVESVIFDILIRDKERGNLLREIKRAKTWMKLSAIHLEERILFFCKFREKEKLEGQTVRKN